MKLKATLLATASTVLLCAAAQAQAPHADADMGRKMVRDALREKMHFKPVKISDMLAALHSTAKGTAASSGRLTTSTAIGNDEGEVHMAINPNDSNKIVVSFMQDNSSGIDFPIYYSSNGGQSWTKSSFNTVAALG